VRKKDKKNLTIAAVSTILIAGAAGGYLYLESADDNGGNGGTASSVENILIASWNLQIFGPTKGSNETLLNYYAEKLDDYDIFIIQEIRDSAGQAIVNLANKLPAYDYIISERAGRSSSKEQYAIFYNNRATLNSQYDWTPERQIEFERPPFQATFTVEDWTFTLCTIHTKPTDVPNEMTHLEAIVGDPTGDTIILGDLNADGSYYNEDNIQHFTDWNWVITNDIDTTVAASDNTYDRIIINNYVDNNYVNKGVMNDVVKGQSDHYLVYAEFDPDESDEGSPDVTPQSNILINEFELNPAGTDSGNEWVELYNPSSNLVDLTGWTLVNNDGDIHSLSGSISTNGYEVVSFSGSWLDNSDEGITLFNSNSNEVDATPIKADSSNDDRTWQRVPNGVDTDTDGDWSFQVSSREIANS
jgi:hypothetical protein